VPFYIARGLSDDHLLAPDAVAIPMRLRREEASPSAGPLIPGLEHTAADPVANLSTAARAYLAALGFPDPDGSEVAADVIWYHALAIGYSPTYLTENEDGVRQDWPRIPMPAAESLLTASAALGRQVAALLDTEKPVPGVTSGRVRGEFKSVGLFERVDGKPARPEVGDLDVTAGWGHAGRRGVTMPGKGKLVQRDDGGLDVFLNDVSCWRNVPQEGWDFTIGGYQVIKKWLSYREKPLLGRSLTPDEVRHVTEMIRRLAALVALRPELDGNYRTVTENLFAWPEG